MAEQNKECKCPKSCVRHGKCDECIAYHLKSKYVPYCERKAKKASGK